MKIEDESRPRTCRTRMMTAYLFVGLMLVTSLLTSCATGSGTEPGLSSVTRTIANYPVVWLETPTLDLNSPDGTFVRALAESWYLREELGPNAYFPGYRQASNTAFRSWDSISPRHDPPHTVYMWVAPFTHRDLMNKYSWPSLSAEVGGASICMAAPTVRFNPGGMLYNYRRTGHAPPSNQHGPRAAPTDNVFGDWRALDFADPMQLLAQECTGPPSPLPTDVRASTPGWPAGIGETR